MKRLRRILPGPVQKHPRSTWGRFREDVYYLLGAAVIILIGIIVVTGYVCYELAAEPSRRRKRERIKQAWGPGPPKPHSYQRLVDIEKSGGLAVSIETTRTEATIAKCADQTDSPLFALPTEVRLLIFEFVLIPSERLHDLHRPSPRRHQRCSYEMLLTCRLIWLEANALALRQAEPTFMHSGPDSFAHPGPEGLGSFTKMLTPNNLTHLNQIHVISDLRWLTSHWYVDTFNRLLGPWRPHRVRVTLWYLDPGLVTCPLGPDGTPITLLGVGGLGGAACALLNIASETGTEELDVEFVARAAWWFTELEQCVDSLRVDRHYLDRAPGWSLVSTEHGVQVTSQSPSGLNVVTRRCLWRRAPPSPVEVATPAEYSEAEAQNVKPSSSSHAEIQRMREIWDCQCSLLTFGDPIKNTTD
ncbi:hypothetical protein CLAFUW4_06870 [Fulvia fulva]|uniref:Uncharacterized protein n=1 Tax=Passalora fulva TaxID=5499 RepID=A0A9Q8PBI8_PASFU|nr:uncharacterized protein CLAFUR5_07008 [Fulvia fulva]KAK4621379.1 hypothetical protein CLAFUR4_06878 [Fulvia fulva]KAK4623491.1 hypothetical protein CLAFUR0_06875 [Fulvia fulva]UJO19411.1 hypothetical protein CLAFUR5_07008 [Fulvia fulva]WPV16323.1 hypothetical protein CLAFUW4_06870 [Fulvia fulva]WPV30769.1 hypothetical protein CLAFUW7_06869 [Fulvia fulva]